MVRRVAVTGGRNYVDWQFINLTLSKEDEREPINVIICGMSPGADSLCATWAHGRGVPIEEYHANWTDLSQADAEIRTRKDGTKYDAKAGPRRNQKMIDEGRPTELMAFEGGSGTADMVRRAKKAGIKITEMRK